MCKQIIGDDKNSRQTAGNFDHHADARVQCKAHPPMELIQGFTRSYWILPLGKCLRCIAPVAVIVDELVESTENTHNNYLQLATYGKINHKLFVRISYPKMDPLLMSLERLLLTLTLTPLFKLKGSATF
jgi:hypothetical protein